LAHFGRGDHLRNFRPDVVGRVGSSELALGLYLVVLFVFRARKSFLQRFQIFRNKDGFQETGFVELTVVLIADIVGWKIAHCGWVGQQLVGRQSLSGENLEALHQNLSQVIGVESREWFVNALLDFGV
jgi:hypothetical protein